MAFPLGLLVTMPQNSGRCNSSNCLGHFKNVDGDDDDDDDDQLLAARPADGHVGRLVCPPVQRRIDHVSHLSLTYTCSCCISVAV